MDRRFPVTLLAALVMLVSGGEVSSQVTHGLPHLKRQGTAIQLIVNGSPFLMLAGELGNSSSSDLDYMSPIWHKLQLMHLNTVLVPVSWELVEPMEGRFDFTLVDGLIYGARNQGLRIVVLWFGTWKNSMSCYAPAWVKQDSKRFPRARTSDGRAIEILSPFGAENLNADRNAFVRLMRHLRELDGKEHTVIMVQVENEIGMIPEARDHSAEAEAAYARPVPADLVTYLQANKGTLTDQLRQAWGAAGSRSSGTWEEMFGKGSAAEEFFMAWHFAKYTNAVVEAGKNEYALPMFVNAALIRPHYRPGQYPSGGPLPHLMDLWRAAAPQIDFLAPDIYFRNFAEWLGRYDVPGNAVFVPEVDMRQSVANAFFALARHQAMGYSPFSIESAEDPPNSQIARGYEVLQQLSPLILAMQGTGDITGFLLDSAAQDARIRLGSYVFTVRHEHTWPYAPHAEGPPPRYGGMIIKHSDDEFTIAGTGVVVTFAPVSDSTAAAGIMSIDEGKFVRGKWVPGRRLNGDQSHQGRHLHLPGGEFGIQRIRLYTYR